MQRSRLISSLTILALGYGLGVFFHPQPTALHAQAVSQTGYERETITNLQLLHQKLGEIATALEGEGKYTSVVDGANSFAIAYGGVDAIKDLEENRGVDPETFAALYAGRASPDVFPHLATDSKGRLTYKDKVVKLYSRERLKKLYTRRDQLLRAR